MADLHDLAPAYAMDALDASEREEFEAHLAECEACQTEVEALRSATVVLAEESAAVPPASLRASVLAAVETTEQQAVVVDMATYRRRRLTTIIATAAAVVLAIVASVSLFGTGSDSEIDDILAAPDAMTVNLDGEGGTGNFTYAISLGSGVLSTDLPRIGSDQIYEVWLIGESGPVPSGLFTPDDDGRAQILVEGVADGQLIGVTLEPAGGSPQPTGEILLLAEL